MKAEIAAEIPNDISVSDVTYEDPELVIYTWAPKKFAQNGDLIRTLAGKLRKRITVRPNPDVFARPADAEAQIRANSSLYVIVHGPTNLCGTW